jgi:hypothetical protein
MKDERNGPDVDRVRETLRERDDEIETSEPGYGSSAAGGPSPEADPPGTQGEDPTPPGGGGAPPEDPAEREGTGNR